MVQDKLTKASMDIILHAGDARLKLTEALKLIEKFDFKNAGNKLNESKKMIQKAHQTQTDTLQAEMRGEVEGHSLLFTHAQDTLMTIYSELNIANRLLKIMEAFHFRLEKLENIND